MRYMWKGFETIEDAKRFQKDNGGALLRWDRESDRYEIAAARCEGYVNEREEYVIAWNVTE